MKEISEMLPAVAAQAEKNSTEAMPYKVDVHPNPDNKSFTDPARYLITSERFAGNAELLFMDGFLQDIKLMETNMKLPQRQNFKWLVPVQEWQLDEFKRHTGVTITKAEFEVSFILFWDTYGRSFPGMKVKKDRAIKAWEALSKSEQLKAFLHIKVYRAFLDEPRNKGRGIKNPDTYLKDKEWEQ